MGSKTEKGEQNPLHIPPLQERNMSRQGEIVLKVIDEFLSMGKVRSIHPSVLCVVVAKPMNKILDLASVFPFVNDGIDLEFFFCIDYEWGRPGGSRAIDREGRRIAVRFEKGNMEGWMNLHVVGEIQGIGDFSHTSKDREGSNELGSKFSRGSLSLVVRGDMGRV